MSDLSSYSRRLLNEARRDERMGPSDKARIREKLGRRIGAYGAVTSALALVRSAPAASSTAALGLPAAAMAKVVAVLALAGATGVGVVRWTGSVQTGDPRTTPGIALSHRTSRSPAAARAETVGKRERKLSQRGTPAATVVCCRIV